MEQQEFTALSSILFLILVLPMTARAQTLCSSESGIKMAENKVGLVTTITTLNAEVVLTFDPPPPDNPFRIDGTQLLAETPLDYEKETVYVLTIRCRIEAVGAALDILVIVEVLNENDESPEFPQGLYNVSVLEFAPENSVVGTFPASDLDSPELFYSLISEPDGTFKLQAPTSATIVVERLLDYDEIKSVKLTLSVRDTEEVSPEGVPSPSTTIMVSIKDDDNRPPWFKPCSVLTSGMIKICPSNGYTGEVSLTVNETDALSLVPGPLYAVDGDYGINERIEYTIVSGNTDTLFKIDKDSGNITTTGPVNLSGPIVLSVMAAQTINVFQFATTTVTIQVLNKNLSNHIPKFEKQQYSGFVSGLGSLVLDQNGTALMIQAFDADFFGGENPNIQYKILGTSNFLLSRGNLFMIKSPLGTVSLQVEAKDDLTGEKTTASVVIEVGSGLPTTTVAPSTTSDTAGPTAPTSSPTGTSHGTVPTSSPTGTSHGTVPTSSPTGTSHGTVPTSSPTGTSHGTVPTSSPTGTSHGTVPTSSPTGTPHGTVSTSSPTGTSHGTVPTSRPTGSTLDPSMTTQGSVSTDSTTQPTGGSVGRGEYSSSDMAALGAPLGVLLFISLGIIGFLLYRDQKGKAAWEKLSEASIFRSALGRGPGGPKDGVQYTNEAFKNDEDSDSTEPTGPMAVSRQMSAGPAARSTEDTVLKSAATLLALLPQEEPSSVEADKADNEKEVKPILTKERRTEEGYKSVWFKEDIVPDATDDVHIIPDPREQDAEEDEESGNEEDLMPRRKVMFGETDDDSGLGVKASDSASDSEYNDMVSSEM